MSRNVSRDEVRFVLLGVGVILFAIGSDIVRTIGGRQLVDLPFMVALLVSLEAALFAIFAGLLIAVVRTKRQTR